MWPDSKQGVGVQHLSENLPETLAEGDAAIVLLPQEDVEVVNDVELAIEYLCKRSIIDCEQPSFCLVFAVHKNLGFVAEPERQSMDQLHNDATQSPHINRRSILIVFHVLQHLNAMGFAVLIEDIIEQFRTHILRSCQLVLLQIFKDKTRAIIDEFKLIGLLLLHLQQDILCLYVGMDYLMMSQQVQSLGDLDHKQSEEICILPKLIVERFVLDHVQLIVFVDIVLSILLVDVIEHISQGSVAALIHDECPGIHDGVGIHPQQIPDSRVAQKFLLRLSVVEEEVAEPDLSQMRLVLIGCIDFLNRVEGLGLEVKPLPNLGESSTAELLSPEIPIDEGLILENGFIMRTFEDRFFIAFLSSRFLIGLRLVPDFALIGFALSSVSIGGFEEELVVGCVVAGAFVQSIALEQFALALVLQFVLLQVGIVVVLAGLTAFVLVLFTGEFQVAQFLDVYVEVYRPLFLFARFCLFPRE